MKMKRCAILSMDNLDDFEVNDQLIELPLLTLGWQTELVSWRQKNVNWDQYQAVIIRSPWDYQDDAASFIKVLEEIDDSTAHLENNLSIVRWNIDKSYLRELSGRGVEIVPTLWHSKFNRCELKRYFEHYQHQDIIIKPTISANADNTFWLKNNDLENHLTELTTVFCQRDYMVQPFLSNVVSEGEFSLFYFNGDYSHAILKTPCHGDFRVQEEHGGKLTAIAPEAELVAAAQNAIEVITELHGSPLYARVDFVRSSTGFALMEAELIEPSLYFNMDEASASKFAKAFDDKMSLLSI